MSRAGADRETLGEAIGSAELAMALQRAWYFLMHGLDQGRYVEGLQIHQLWLLAVLTRGPRTMGELARVTSTTQANVTGMVARLEKRGLVTRSHSESDRRLVEVSLTDVGREAIAERNAALTERTGQITRDMKDDERARLLRLLNKVANPNS